MTLQATTDSAFLTTAEFAQRVGVSVSTVKRLADAGQLAHIRVGCHRRIPASEVARLLDEAERSRS